MTLAFWQAGDYSAAGRAVRDWIRAERERPAPYRYAARIYEGMGALSQAVDAAERETAAAPSDASAWERLGRLRLRVFDREGAREALERARETGPSETGPAGPRAGRAPARRRRRRGLGVRAGDAARAGVRGRLGALRARAGADRPRVRLSRGLRAGAGLGRRSGGARPARSGRADGPARAARGLDRQRLAGGRPIFEPGVRLDLGVAYAGEWPPRWCIGTRASRPPGPTGWRSRPRRRTLPPGSTSAASSSGPTWARPRCCAWPASPGRASTPRRGARRDGSPTRW